MKKKKEIHIRQDRLSIEEQLAMKGTTQITDPEADIVWHSLAQSDTVVTEDVQNGRIGLIRVGQPKEMLGWKGQEVTDQGRAGQSRSREGQESPKG